MDKEKINALLVLERANQLPQEQAKALSTLRAAGMVPPLSGAQNVPFKPSPKFLEKGGFADVNLLSGQIPLVATGVAGLLTGKNPITSPIPVGLVGAGAENLERIGRVLVGLDKPQTTGQAFKSAAEDFAKHASYEAAGGSFAPAIKAAGGLVKGTATEAKELFKNVLTENIPVTGGVKKYLEGRAARRAAGKISEQASKFGVQDVLMSGRRATQEGADVFESASKEYLGLKNAMLGRFGSTKVSPEQFRKAMDSEIKGITELAGDLDPRDAALKKTLQKWQARFSASEGNPTLQEMDDITATLYNASQKPNANPAFARLHRAARENLLNAMDDAVELSGKKARPYRDAIKESERLAKAQTGLIEESKQPLKGQRQLSEIATAQKELMSKQENMTQIIDALDSANEVEAAQAREAYRAARQKISKTLRVKEGPIGKLIEHGKELPSEISEKARTLGRLDLPEVLDEAFDVDPRFRGVARESILADIFSRSGDQKALQKAVSQYKNVLPKVLNESELSGLLKIAGQKTTAKTPPWIKPEAISDQIGRLFPTVLRSVGNEIERE